MLAIAQSEVECRNVSVVICYNIETSVPKAVYRHKSNIFGTKFNKKVFCFGQYLFSDNSTFHVIQIKYFTFDKNKITAKYECLSE